MQKKRTKKSVKKIKTPKTKVSNKLLKLLKTSKIKYELVHHKTVFTAYDLSQTLKIKPSQVVKTLVVKADKNVGLALLPGHLKLDTNKLKKVAQAKKITIVSEKEMVQVFKVKAGAITPFSSLYKVPVYLENALSRVGDAYFQSGSFNEAIKMKIKDFVDLEKPIKGDFGKK